MENKVEASHIEHLTLEERRRKIEELQVLDEELKCLRKNAKVYQSSGNSNVLFIADKHIIHSETKLRLSKLTEAQNKLKK